MYVHIGKKKKKKETVIIFLKGYFDNVYDKT